MLRLSLFVAILTACGARSSLETSALVDAAASRCATACAPPVCPVRADELIAPAFTTNDTTSITVAADGNVYVLVEAPTPAYHGDVFVRRGADRWEHSSSDVVATGALAIDPSGSTPSFAPGVGPYAFVAYDGAFHAHVASLIGGAPYAGTPLPTDQSVSSPNVWLDSHGVVRMLTDGSTGRGPSQPTYITYDAHGAHARMFTTNGARAFGGRLTLEVNDVAWAAWLELAGLPRMPSDVRVFREDTGAIESAPSVMGALFGIAIVAGSPILAVGDSPAQLITLARRPDGSWDRHELVGSEGPAACPACTVEQRSVTMFARGDGAVILFAGTELDGHGGQTTHLFATTPDAPTGSATVVFTHPNAVIRGARAVADGCDRVHIAYDEGDTTSGEVHARYALLAP